jgi:hypothetical protein
VVPEALGTDYGAAKQRCDEVLNPHYRSWLAHWRSMIGSGTLITAAAI